MHVFIANWKNQVHLKEIDHFIDNFSLESSSDLSQQEVVVCPPFPYIQYVVDKVKNTKNSMYAIGAQDCHYTDNVSTAKVMPSALHEIGCKYVIVGHSETGAADDVVAKKIKYASKNSLKPIICIGDNMQSADDSIKTSLARLIALHGCKEIIVAYEPLWAIGGNTIPQPAHINSIRNTIKDYLFTRYSNDIRVKVVYGGSVNHDNISDLHGCCDGVMIGRASIDPNSLIDIIRGFK